jgi:hypothetical protein
MTSQEMINDSVAQLIRQEILLMLVCWQRLQETFSNHGTHVHFINMFSSKSKCNTIVYHLLRCHPGKFRIFIYGASNHCQEHSSEMESPIAKSYAVHMKRRTLV